MKLISKFRNVLRSWLGVDYGPTVDDMIAMGMKVGKNFWCDHVRIDTSHCWLISIGDDVTFGPMYTFLLTMQALKPSWATQRLAKSQ